MIQSAPPFLTVPCNLDPPKVPPVTGAMLVFPASSLSATSKESSIRNADFSSVAAVCAKAIWFTPAAAAAIAVVPGLLNCLLLSDF